METTYAHEPDAYAYDCPCRDCWAADDENGRDADAPHAETYAEWAYNRAR